MHILEGKFLVRVSCLFCLQVLRLMKRPHSAILCRRETVRSLQEYAVRVDLYTMGGGYEVSWFVLGTVPRHVSGVPRGCVNRIRLWSLRRDDHSGVLIGAGGERRSDWPARVLANEVSTRINR